MTFCIHYKYWGRQLRAPLYSPPFKSSTVPPSIVAAHGGYTNVQLTLCGVIATFSLPSSTFVAATYKSLYIYNTYIMANITPYPVTTEMPTTTTVFALQVSRRRI